MTFNAKETATLLAALRLLQTHHVAGRMYSLPPPIEEGYFNMGEIPMPTPKEIDELCKKINGQ